MTQNKNASHNKSVNDALGKYERAQRLGHVLLNWGPVVLTAGAILYFSSQSALPQAIAAPTPRGESIRQAIHVLEYTTLAFWLYRALTRTRHVCTTRPRRIMVTLVFGITFSLCDEWHQQLIPNRDLSLMDVLADGIGTVAGTSLGLVYSLLKARHAFPAFLNWI